MANFKIKGLAKKRRLYNVQLKKQHFTKEEIDSILLSNKEKIIAHVQDHPHYKKLSPHKKAEVDKALHELKDVHNKKDLKLWKNKHGGVGGAIIYTILGVLLLSLASSSSFYSNPFLGGAIGVAGLSSIAIAGSSFRNNSINNRARDEILKQFGHKPNEKL